MKHLTVYVVFCVLFCYHMSSGLSGGESRRTITDMKNILKEMEFIDKRLLKADDAVSDWLAKNDVTLATQINKMMGASWNYLTNLTTDNADKLSRLQVSHTKWMAQRIKEAKRFLDQSQRVTDPDNIRMLHMWVYGQENPVPDDKEAIRVISDLETQLQAIFGKAEVTKDGKTYRIEPEFEQLMATSRDWEELKWAWQAWRDATGPKVKQPFTELVNMLNQAARDNGLDDIGVSWRMASYYDDNIVPMVDDLYDQILPLYTELHAYVRDKLWKYYGEQSFDPNGPIPAHILGNMWAQEWMNIDDVLTPFPEVASDDVTSAMVAQNYTPLRMFRLAEEFFTSIGLEPMTEKFWNLSMIVRPKDRPVECHGAAEDLMTKDDFRRYDSIVRYDTGPFEEIGSSRGITQPPEGKKQNDHSCFNALKRCTTEQKRELNQLMKIALEKVAFLPFGYLIDKWRWDVFSGEIDENHYNSKWWEYRLKYQGVAPPVERTENDFDPGAKYHVPSFVPYIRYFLSFIGQFEFHDALCKASGHSGALYNCDIYQSKKAGRLLKSVLHLGASKPWEEVLNEFTGKSHFSTDAIYKYFSPLYSWLKTYNKKNNIKIGWNDVKS